jgi:Virulence-associated protein E/VirE N-terminal domain
VENESEQVSKIRASFFETITAKPGKSLAMDEIFNIVRTGDGIKETITLLRAETDKSKAEEIKKTLPAVTPSGLFTGARKLQNLTDYTGILCLDFDNVSNPELRKQELAKDPYCYAILISPSGNGLKALVKVTKDQNKHGFFYDALIQYYKIRYNVTADKSCKDITRAMFLSSDKDIVVNDGSAPWTIVPGDELNYELVQSALAIKETFNPGNRNNYVYLLASGCSRKGISREFAERTIVAKYTTNGFTEREALTTINSAYNGEGNVPQISVPAVITRGLSLLTRVEDYINKKYEIRFNEVSTKIEWKNKIPDSLYQELNENSLYRELEHANLNISLAKLASLMQSDFVSKYNPFKDYFEGLNQWDDNTDPDYILKLSSYIPAVDKERFRKHFLKMLVRSVACALDDRVFNKQVFVLVHDVQNSGKSTFCRWLCPPTLRNYITENINTDKDSLIALATNLLINMDELATLSRTEINQLKSFISKDKINVRLPYAKKTTLIPRRASFIGSTNKDEFLTDETGSVRWLCFDLNGMINFKYSEEVDINDVWRQAYALYKAGFEYQLTPAEIEENEKANDAFQVQTTEMQLIPKMFAPSSKEGKGGFFTASDIQLNIERQFIGARLNIYNIGRAMKRLGFRKESQYLEARGYTQKGYYVKLLTNHTTQLPDLPYNQ